MRDLMLEISADLAPESITEYASHAHLEMSQFHACMDAKKYSPDVQRDVAAGNTIGINATPSFVIGKTAKDQIDGVRIAGALSYPAFENAIQNQTPHPTAIAAAK